MTPTGTIGIDQMSGETWIYGGKLPTPSVDARYNLIEQSSGVCTVRNTTIASVNTGGSAIKAACDSVALSGVAFIGVGAARFQPRAGGSASDASAWVATNCVGGTAARWEIADCEFLGSCTGSGYGTVLYIQGDFVRLRGCLFRECGQTLYMPSLRTPASKPTIICEACRFIAGEYWYERANTWWPAVGLTIHSAARLICVNCTWEGTWRHLFRYVDPARYVGIANDYSRLKAHDPSVLIGTSAGTWMTLDQWCAQYEIATV